ncbi:unnamed protein product [Caenorhabditis angaria]|uniref:Uncharacterized protein n=1 Tax=Caenorhabditis angaria TaxID=860376 RepID=A0A9P1IGY1_9PELO|nr:unnamed protein product [Caenorhabditis angaria]
MGQPSKLVEIPNELIAFMRTSSQILYSVPQALIYWNGFRATVGCSYDTVQSATMYGYQIQNTSCTTQIESALEKIREIESIKMDTTCSS